MLPLLPYRLPTTPSLLSVPAESQRSYQPALLGPEKILAPITNVGFQDMYSVPVSAGTTVPEFTYAMMKATPGWMHGLFHVHDIFSKPLSQKHQRYDYPLETIRLGDKVGPFPVIRISPNEVQCGNDDKHIRFRSRYQLVSDANGQLKMTCTTTVQYLNRRGHLYFALIRPFHHWLLPRLMKEITGQPVSRG